MIDDSLRSLNNKSNKTDISDDTSKDFPEPLEIDDSNVKDNTFLKDKRPEFIGKSAKLKLIKKFQKQTFVRDHFTKISDIKKNIEKSQTDKVSIFTIDGFPTRSNYFSKVESDVDQTAQYFETFSLKDIFLNHNDRLSCNNLCIITLLGQFKDDSKEEMDPFFWTLFNSKLYGLEIITNNTIMKKFEINVSSINLVLVVGTKIGIRYSIGNRNQTIKLVIDNNKYSKSKFSDNELEKNTFMFVVNLWKIYFCGTKGILNLFIFKFQIIDAWNFLTVCFSKIPNNEYFTNEESSLILIEMLLEIQRESIIESLKNIKNFENAFNQSKFFTCFLLEENYIPTYEYDDSIKPVQVAIIMIDDYIILYNYGHELLSYIPIGNIQNIYINYTKFIMTIIIRSLILKNQNEKIVLFEEATEVSSSHSNKMNLLMEFLLNQKEIKPEKYTYQIELSDARNLCNMILNSKNRNFGSPWYKMRSYNCMKNLGVSKTSKKHLNFKGKYTSQRGKSCVIV